MKVLTVCQPYPTLIVTPQERLPAGQVRKRCENRTWETRYRGPLLIHAGRSREWLDTCQWPAAARADLVFGAILGIALLEDVVQVRRNGLILECPAAIKQKYRGLGIDLEDHPHCLGPVAWLLPRSAGFNQPVTVSGAQGLWELPEEGPLWEQVQAQLRACRWPAEWLRVRWAGRPARAL